MKSHILQSKQWEKFKNDYGTSAVRAGNVLYTKHKIPFTQYFYGYSPRVNPFEIDFEAVKKSLEENECIALHFDVPNVTTDEPDYQNALNIFEKHCIKSDRDEFAKGNFFIDLTKTEEELFNNMHKKHKYNVNYAQKKGLKVKRSVEDKDFEIFYSLYKETGDRQKFYGRSKNYLEKVWDTFKNEGNATLLTAYFEETPLSSWMLLNYESVLYYPYGGSTEKMKNLQSSCYLGWEAIKLGKELGCELFDMWGAAENMSNISDPYYGFSLFKEKFGAKHVVYIDSYDLVINKTIYKMFNAANDIRWKLLNMLK